MEYFGSLLLSLGELGHIWYWIVFVIATLESFAFIGTFIPGSSIVVFAGFLSAEGHIDAWKLMLFSSFGAIMGDIFSYWLGTKGLNYFKNENKYLKRDHLDKGEAFFKKYGNKSVFWGRFIAPIRSIVPFIAGLSRMDKKEFIFWNVLSGIIWAVMHVLIGYFFGDVWGEIKTWTTRIGLLGLIGILAGLAFYLNKRNKLYF